MTKLIYIICFCTLRMSSGHINIKLARKLINQGAIILDIRTEKEYCSFHICGSIHIETKLPPLNRNDLKKLARKLNRLNGLNVRKTHPIIVYCKKGVRAGIAKEILELLRYSNVHSLGGVDTQPLQSYIKNPKYKELVLCRCIH